MKKLRVVFHPKIEKHKCCETFILATLRGKIWNMGKGNQEHRKGELGTWELWNSRTQERGINNMGMEIWNMGIMEFWNIGKGNS